MKPIVIGILAWAFSGIGLLFIPAVRSFFRKLWNRLARREFIPSGIDFQVRPFKPADYDLAAELAAYYLGQGRSISPQTAELWARKNGELFLCVECRSDEEPSWHFCGFYSIIPMTPVVASLLKQGKIQDYELTVEAILPFDDPEVSEVYIMDLMTDYRRCGHHECCKIAASFLIRRMRKFLVALKTRNPSITKVFTIVASKNGARLAERSGFIRQREFKSPYGWQLYEAALQTI